MSEPEAEPFAENGDAGAQLEADESVGREMLTPQDEAILTDEGRES